MGENEMKPNSRLPQNVRLSEWLGGTVLNCVCADENAMIYKDAFGDLANAMSAICFAL